MKKLSTLIAALVFAVVGLTTMAFTTTQPKSDTEWYYVDDLGQKQGGPIDPEDAQCDLNPERVCVQEFIGETATSNHIDGYPF